MSLSQFYKCNKCHVAQNLKSVGLKLRLEGFLRGFRVAAARCLGYFYWPRGRRRGRGCHRITGSPGRPVPAPARPGHRGTQVRLGMSDSDASHGALPVLTGSSPPARRRLAQEPKENARIQSSGNVKSQSQYQLHIGIQTRLNLIHIVSPSSISIRSD